MSAKQQSTRAASARVQRVGERIRVELMELLLRGVMGDPRTEQVLVTSVRPTTDLKIAKVYIRLLDPNASEQIRKNATLALNRASRFLRYHIGPKLQLKYNPELRFYWDDTLDQATQIEQLLDEINQGSNAKPTTSTDRT